MQRSQCAKETLYCCTGLTFSLITEEESKRLQASYQQISFNYDGNTATEPKEEPKDEEPDETFVPNPKFHIPADIEIVSCCRVMCSDCHKQNQKWFSNLLQPQSLKHHAIIEKTAKFIASQGPQMEILIKAKQSNNPLFEFLNQNNRMNKYYKHVMNAIKDSTYPMIDEKVDHQDDNSNDTMAAEPLSNNSIAEVQYQPMLVPTLKYKPSADCSYTQLISKIKGVPMPLNQIDDTVPATNTTTNSSTPSSYTYSSYYSNDSKTEPASKSAAAVPLPTTAILPTAQKLLLDLDHEKLKATIQSKAEGVEIKKISTGLMLAQCYNSDSESDDDGTDVNSKMPKIGESKISVFWDKIERNFPSS